jgi:hypothetical protein
MLMSEDITDRQKRLLVVNTKKSMNALANAQYLVLPQEPMVQSLVAAMRGLDKEHTKVQICAGLHRGWMLGQLWVLASKFYFPTQLRSTWSWALSALLADTNPNPLTGTVYMPSVAEATFFVALLNSYDLDEELGHVLATNACYVAAATQRFMSAIHLVRHEPYLIHDVVSFASGIVVVPLDILEQARQNVGSAERLAKWANSVGLPDTLMDMAREGWPEPTEATSADRQKLGQGSAGSLEWFLRAVELMKDWTFLVSNPAGAIASVEARTEDIRRLTDIAVNDETIVAIINAQAASEIVVRGLQNAEAQWSLIKQGWIAAVFRAQKHLFGDAGSSGDVSVVSPLP